MDILSYSYKVIHGVPLRRRSHKLSSSSQIRYVTCAIIFYIFSIDVSYNGYVIPERVKSKVFGISK